MAQLAGTRLRERFQDWDRAPFTGASRKRVSVCEKIRRLLPHRAAGK